ncbi:helix-turn-helix transcriptional regulator [Geminicoccaceae bacterium SYSU G07066]|uniref:Helix-turn-helix transcriptional regulator n=1 Tax=Benzoatithermus flavus TaxID=3108223 RepID=A0ABU8XMJ5_9PROT
MHKPLSAAQRRSLGDFLRVRRERLMPQHVGIPAGPRRRTPGLRREEVAQLCGLSVTWYSWIEQGRDVSVSPTALARIARALRLDRAERAYLFELAGRKDPQLDPHGDATDLPDVLADCVEAIRSPAYVLDRLWNARAWNVAARDLFTGWLDGAEKNLLRFIFLDPVARSLVCDWELRARRVVAEFRADVSAHLDDPRTGALIEELARRSTLFARCWQEQDVVAREGGERTFQHPQRGLVRYRQTTFQLAAHVGWKLVMLLDRTAVPEPPSDAKTGLVAKRSAGSGIIR